MLCRAGAAQLSDLKPVLDSMGVRLVGVGLETFGYDEFAAGGFFSGEIYIDEKAAGYKKLSMPSLGLFSSIGSLLTDKSVRKAHAFATERGISGNLKGNGSQLGAVFVVVDGKQVFAHRQQGYGDHPENESIMEALAEAGLVPPAEAAAEAAAAPVSSSLGFRLDLGGGDGCAACSGDVSVDELATAAVKGMEEFPPAEAVGTGSADAATEAAICRTLDCK